MTVRLTTLGHPRVLRGEEELPHLPGKPVTFGVFVFVAVEGQVTRDRLVGVFWPESPQDKARHTLSQTLYEIRQALGDDGLQSSGASLRPPPDLWVDCAEFSRLAEEEEDARAVALYSGPFLDGVHLARTHPFQEWVERHRGSLARRFRGAAERFITLSRNRGKLEPALDAAMKWSGLDPLDDGAQHHLIHLLAQTGNRTEALAQFDRYAALLEAELGLDPLEETVALVKEIRAGAFDPGKDPTSPPSSPPPHPPDASLPSHPSQPSRPPRPSPPSEGNGGQAGEKTSPSSPSTVWPPPLPDSVVGEAVVARALDRAELQHRMELELSPTLEVIRPIGQGSMGHVFLAREPHLKRLVAVKVLSPKLYADEGARARFEREAQAAARIQSPHVCTVYRVGSLADGTPFLVSPFVKGTTLEDRLKAHGRLDPSEVRLVLREVATALAAAHRIGIVHRDVRPANVLRSEDTGRHSLCDFGIAGVLETGEETGSKLTKTGEIMGDPAYISPEQMEGLLLTDRADIYSLGVLGHQLLLGHTPPPCSDGRGSLPRDGAAVDLTPLREFLSDRDPALATLLARCLAEDPAHRPRAEDLVAALGEDREGGRREEAGGMEPEPDSRSGLLALLLRKRLPQILGAYLASAWAAVEAADFLTGRGLVSDAVLQATLVSVPAGFFAVSVVGWFHGEKGRQPMPTVERWLIWVLAITWVGALAWVFVT